MQDITKMRMNKVPHTIWDSPEDKIKVNEPNAIVTKIFSSPKTDEHRQDMHRLFRSSPGSTDNPIKKYKKKNIRGII